MIDDFFLSNFGLSFYNMFFLLGLVNDLNPFGESVFIPSKSLMDSQMPVSSGGARTVLITMVIILPLVIMGIGIFVWRKRRHK
jgi:hypothetical protein